HLGFDNFTLLNRATNPPGVFPVPSGLTSSSRGGTGVEGSLTIFGVSGSVSYTSSGTADEQFPADRNGDGFVDLVHVGDNRVRVNYNDGHRHFLPASELDADLLTDDMVPSHPERTRQLEGTPIDPLVRWTAPYAGSFVVDGKIEKVRS